MRVRIVALSVLLAVGWFRYSRADVLGPLLPSGTLELGVRETWVNRTVVNAVAELDWEYHDMSIVSRWGVTRFATVAIEGMAGAGPWLTDHDDTQLFYVIGGGVQATIWRNARVAVTGTFSYRQTIQQFSDPAARTLRTTGEVATILGETDFRVGADAVLTVWGGPIASQEEVVYDENRFLQGQGYIEDATWGGVLGVTAVLLDHVNISGHLIYVEHPQPRVALLYRF